MNETATSLDYSGELRETYLGAFPHTLFTAIVWISSGVSASFLSKPQTILLFIVAGTFTFPGGELIRKMLRSTNVLSKGNRLPQLFTLLAFTIPLSYPLVYLIVKNNINLFFSAFTILVGAHYLPFIYGYRMYSFGLLAVLLVSFGTYFSVLFPYEFALPALVTGALLLAFAFLHYFIIKTQKL